MHSKIFIISALFCFTLIGSNREDISQKYDFFSDYEKKYFDFSKNSGISIGIAVLGYNRTDYFFKIITSLASNPESQTLPFFIFLDGGTKANQEELENIVKESGIKEFYIIKQKENLGCGRSIINARRFMFDWCKFEKIILFEDDLVVSRDYIRFILNLHTWAREHFSNVGAVTGFNLCFLDEQSKENQLDCVQETYGNFWGYCMDSAVYKKIKNFMNEYEKKILINIPRPNNNGNKLALWMLKKLVSYIEKYEKKLIKNNKTLKEIESKINYIVRFFFHLVRIAATGKRREGQDIEMRFALFLAGFLKLSPIVNRALYIGQQGVHHTPYTWERDNFGLMHLDEKILLYDHDLKVFKVVEALIPPIRHEKEYIKMIQESNVKINFFSN
jgi:hypothetical protein